MENKSDILLKIMLEKLRELELLRKEQQVIIDSMHDGIWVIDADGVTVHVNQAMKRIANIAASDVVGKHVSIPMREGKFTTCVTLKALEKQAAVTLFDDYVCGTRCLNTSTPIFDDDGRIWRVVASIRDITELENLQKRLARSELVAHGGKGQPDIIAVSDTMRACLAKMEKAAAASLGVLLLGETGTGKTLAASYIHKKSARSTGPFINVNCAAIPENLIESELFGYEKGSFTGAGKEGKKGFFELADNGTLLLDEIGELPLSMQAKLLHVLDNQIFHRVGGQKSISVDVRVIAATNRPLEHLVAAGKFRMDLFYRLRILTITLPPLREHAGDIPDMAMFFLKDACKRYGTIKIFSPVSLRCLSSYCWPGNVRELRAAVEFLAAMTEGSIIQVSELPAYILEGASKADFRVRDDNTDGESGSMRAAVQALEKKMISEAIVDKGSSYKAAKLLGISQSTVVRKAQQYGIPLKD